MKPDDTITTQPWSGDQVAALQTRLLDSKRLLDAFPADLPTPCLLRRVSGNAQGDVAALPLAGEVVVGRKGDPPFCFPEDSSLSRRHFRILVGDSGRCFAEPLTSTNKLWINGRHITSHRRLVHGDQIHAGNQDFVFHDGGAGGNAGGGMTRMGAT